MPLRVLDCRGTGNSTDVIAALDWVVQHKPAGPSVINLSLGGGADPALDAAVEATVAAGIPVVVAAGNGDRFGNPYDACVDSPGSGTVGHHRRGLRPLRPASLLLQLRQLRGPVRPGRGHPLGLRRIRHRDVGRERYVDGGPACGRHRRQVAGRRVTRPRTVITRATPGKISDPAGSPNRLAYAQGPARRTPAGPTAVRVSKADKTASATISWTAPTDQGTSPITAYKITQGRDRQPAPGRRPPSRCRPPAVPPC